MTKLSSDKLIAIAAQMLRAEEFISEFPGDNPKATPKRVLRQAERQREILTDWAVAIRAVVDSEFKQSQRESE